MSQKQSNKESSKHPVSEEIYNLYYKFVCTPHKEEHTTEQATRKKKPKKTSRQILLDIEKRRRARESRNMEADDDNKKPAAVDTAPPQNTTSDMETEDEDNNKKPAAVKKNSQTTAEETKKNTPQKKRKSGKRDKTTNTAGDATKPWTDVASLPVIEQGDGKSTGEQDVLMTPKGKKVKLEVVAVQIKVCIMVVEGNIATRNRLNVLSR